MPVETLGGQRSRRSRPIGPPSASTTTALLLASNPTTGNEGTCGAVPVQRLTALTKLSARRERSSGELRSLARARAHDGSGANSRSHPLPQPAIQLGTGLLWRSAPPIV